jgi:hypothetical protein
MLSLFHRRGKFISNINIKDPETAQAKPYSIPSTLDSEDTPSSPRPVFWRRLTRALRKIATVPTFASEIKNINININTKDPETAQAKPCSIPSTIPSTPDPEDISSSPGTLSWHKRTGEQYPQKIATVTPTVNWLEIQTESPFRVLPFRFLFVFIFFFFFFSFFFFFFFFSSLIR